MPCAVADPVTLGQDAFVPPSNFAEFLERHSTLVRWWLIRKMRCPMELVEDYEQSLFVHLMGRSKNMMAKGIEDRVATYVAERSGGEAIKNERSIWMKYICDRVLRNEYIKLVRRNMRGGTRGDNVISLTTHAGSLERATHSPQLYNILDVTPGQAADLEQHTVQASHGPAVVSREFWEGFISFVAVKAPEIVPMLRALEDFDTLPQIKAHLGLDQATYDGYKDTLLRLMKAYRRQGRLY